MKSKITLLFGAALLLAASSLYAVDQIAVEPALKTSADSRSVESLPWLVTGTEELVLKPGTVFTEGMQEEGMQLPYLISTPVSVTYPRWALRQGWEGDFSIAIEIKLDGTVGRYKVMKSTGREILDESAIKAIQSWKFHPAMKEGKAVLSCIQIPVRFQISEK